MSTVKEFMKVNAALFLHFHLHGCFRMYCLLLLLFHAPQS
jgi:hypothetical protein